MGPLPSSYRTPKTHYSDDPVSDWEATRPACGERNHVRGYVTHDYAYQVDCGRCLRILEARRGRGQDALADATTSPQVS